MWGDLPGEKQRVHSAKKETAGARFNDLDRSELIEEPKKVKQGQKNQERERFGPGNTSDM